MKLTNLFNHNMLQESVFYKGDIQGFKNHEHITILKDPSALELQGLLNKSKKNELRGLITYNDEGLEEYYFWDASIINHYLFSQQFGFGDDDGDINFILTKNSILFPDYMIHPEKYGIKDEEKLYNNQCDIEMVTKDYKINKLYPNGFKIGVSY